MRPIVIYELLSGKTLNDVNKEHGIDFGIYDRKVSLNYNQIASKSSDDIASQCRGLIISEIDGSEILPDKPMKFPFVLARPFGRFFNLGDPAACSQQIDLEDVAYVKYDGTLIIVYYDHVIKKDWCVATRSVPEANQKVQHEDYIGTFRDLFEQILRVKGLPFPELTKKLQKDYTYCFELVSSYNHMVCVYPKPDVIFLARIDNATGKELLIEYVDFPSEIQKARTIPIKSHQEMIDYIESLPFIESEGTVVVKRNGNEITGRMKIKSKDYKNAHCLKSSAESSRRNIVSLVLDEKWDDARTIASPKALEFGDSVSVKIMERSGEIEKVIEEAIRIGNGNRKDTAMAAKNINPNWVPFVMMKFDNKWEGYLTYLKKTKKDLESYPNNTLDSIVGFCLDAESQKADHVI